MQDYLPTLKATKVVYAESTRLVRWTRVMGYLGLIFILILL